MSPACRFLPVLLISIVLPAHAWMVEEAAPPAKLGPAWSVAYSPDGRLLAAGGGTANDAGVLAVWELPSGKTRLWVAHPRGVRSVAFSPDGRIVATGCWDNQIRFCDVATGKAIAVLKGHAAVVNSLAFAPDGKTLASAGLDKAVILWDVEARKELRRCLGHTDWVLSVAFSPDGKWLVSVGKDATIRLWTTTSGKQVRMTPHAGGPLEGVAVSPGGQIIATGGWNCRVGLWDVETGQENEMLRGHDLGVLAVAFSPDGSQLASVCGDYNREVGGEGILWALPDGKAQATLKGHTNSVWAVRFAPDGRSLATASRDGSVKIWETMTAKERLTLSEGRVNAAPKPREPLTEKDLEAIWKDLYLPEPGPAYRAMSRLVQAPDEAVPWLARQLKREPLDADTLRKQVQKLIVQLDDDDFDVRERADAELAELGPAVAPLLRKTLDATVSAEVRHHLTIRLEKLKVSLGDPERLRARRAVEALELLNTPEARKLLRQLAQGEPSLPATKEAEASSRRLPK